MSKRSLQFAKVLLLVVLVVAIQLAHAEEKVDPTEGLEALEFEELQTRLSDLHDGKISLKKFTTKEELIDAIVKKYKKIEEDEKFEAMVSLAVIRRDESYGDFLHNVHVEADFKSGHIQKFNEFKEQFKNTLPNFEDLEFTVTRYVDTQNTQAFSFSTVFQYGGYLCLFLALAGDHMPLPAGVKNFFRTRRNLIFSTSMMLSLASSNAGRTHAFEVHVDNRLVYSGLANSRPPTVDELRQILLQETLLRDYA